MTSPTVTTPNTSSPLRDIVRRKTFAHCWIYFCVCNSFHWLENMSRVQSPIPTRYLVGFGRLGIMLYYFSGTSSATCQCCVGSNGPTKYSFTSQLFHPPRTATNQWDVWRNKVSRISTEWAPNGVMGPYRRVTGGITLISGVIGL